MAGPGRDGPPPDERLVESETVIAFLDAGDRLGVFDFTEDQYFSWIRSRRILVRVAPLNRWAWRRVRPGCRAGTAR